MTDETKAEKQAIKDEAAESNKRRQEITDGERAGDQPRFREATPRDVAINKTKQGEDVGLEASRPDKVGRFRVPGRFGERFEDFAGRTWEVVKVKESQRTLIDPEAVKKDGGDPHILGVASAPPVTVERGEVPEKALVPRVVGNAQPSEDPVEAPKDRAKIQSEDHPSTRPGSPTARAAKAEAKAVDGGEEKPSKLKRAARAVLRKK